MNFSGVVSDQLGAVPAKTRELLRQAVELGVANELQKSRASGLDPDEAIKSVAAMLVSKTPTDATGCVWVTRELARALGMTVRDQGSQTARGTETESPAKTPEDFQTAVAHEETVGPNHSNDRAQFPGVDRGAGTRSRMSSAATAGVIGVVVVVVVALLIANANHMWPFSAVATTATTPPSPVPPSSTSTSTSSTTAAVPIAKQEATTLSDLLVQSASDRTAIVNAVSSISSCQNLSGDAQTLVDAANSRQNLLNGLEGLNLSTLPSGSQLSQALAGAWTNSKASDQSYADWAGDELNNGCTINDTSDPNYQNAQSSDSQSTTEKTMFTNLWNPIATQYGLPTVTPTSF
jgi:hypothetical protein